MTTLSTDLITLTDEELDQVAAGQNVTSTITIIHRTTSSTLITNTTSVRSTAR